MKVVQIPVSMISANPEQPRKVFKDSELEELTESIAEYGVLQPLIVKRAEGRRFVLVAGERRLRAACLAGLKTVPAIVKEIQDREAALIALVENVQRENLNFLYLSHYEFSVVHLCQFHQNVLQCDKYNMGFFHL